MEIDKKAVKEWKAQYQLINEMEHEELKERLATETVEQSVRSYFAMCQLATSLAGSTDVPPEFQEERERHYIELAEKWQRLAEKLKHV
ncbi:MAG: hypothetical protein FD146_2301 [Anaerolineaceae bacterium]|nr:MAG: hypothetical protein FD146_2301 [Anaerolineaceae bacterium]